MSEPKYAVPPAYVSAVPSILDRSDVLAALEPLGRLCGVDLRSIYGDPGLSITYDKITFAVPAAPDDPDKRPSSDDEYAEWVVDVTIPVADLEKRAGA